MTLASAQFSETRWPTYGYYDDDDDVTSFNRICEGLDEKNILPCHVGWFVKENFANSAELK